MAALRRKGEVDTCLVDGYRIGRRHNPNIVNVRLGRISVTVAVDGNIVQNVDIDNPVPISQIIRHGFSGFRHGLRKSGLLADPGIIMALTGRVDQAFSFFGAKSDGNIFDCSLYSMKICQVILVLLDIMRQQ